MTLADLQTALEDAQACRRLAWTRLSTLARSLPDGVALVAEVEGYDRELLILQQQVRDLIANGVIHPSEG